MQSVSQHLIAGAKHILRRRSNRIVKIVMPDPTLFPKCSNCLSDENNSMLNLPLVKALHSCLDTSDPPFSLF